MESPWCQPPAGGQHVRGGRGHHHSSPVLLVMQRSVNRVLRSAASTASSEKLYLGCAATGALPDAHVSMCLWHGRHASCTGAKTCAWLAVAGELKLHVLSMPAGGLQVAKTVTWPITALSACPASSCHNRTSLSTPASSRPTVTSTADGNPVITLTGNPLADLHMLHEMFISSISPFSFPTSLDAGTAFQLVDSECPQLNGSSTVALPLMQRPQPEGFKACMPMGCWPTPWLPHA